MFKNIKQDDLITLKLATGEEVIGKYKETEEHRKNP